MAKATVKKVPLDYRSVIQRHSNLIVPTRGGRINPLATKANAVKHGVNVMNQMTRNSDGEMIVTRRDMHGNSIPTYLNGYNLSSLVSLCKSQLHTGYERALKDGSKVNDWIDFDGSDTDRPVFGNQLKTAKFVEENGRKAAIEAVEKAIDSSTGCGNTSVIAHDYLSDMVVVVFRGEEYYAKFGFKDGPTMLTRPVVSVHVSTNDANTNEKRSQTN